MWKVTLLALVLFGSALAQVQDLTRQPGAAGPQVVESVVSLIHESCVFPNDRLLLRRVAYFATRDGQDPGTYRQGFDGGIWGVTQTDFTVTQHDSRLQMYYNDTLTRFGIDWNRVQWSDLRKPLFSGLAAALFLVQSFGDSVPAGVENQATWYQRLAYPSDPGMAYNFTKLAQQLDIACSSSNLDLAFLVDSSSSLSPTDFRSALKFVADVLDTFTVSPTAVRVALITFGTGFQTVFDFDQYSSKAEVQNAIKSALYTPGQTDTDQALGYAASTLFTAGSGSRVASAKVAVVVTDGKATHSSDAIQKAEELRNKGVSVFVIGVGDQIDKVELNNLATKPSCTHVQTLQGYQDLDSLRAQIQQLSCFAPVVLQEGTNTFPCNNKNNFRVTNNGNSTISISTSNGFVDIYGSFLNPNPNAAFNEFSMRALSNQMAQIYVKEESRPLYLSVVSQGTDPAICHAGGNFTIVVQFKDAITTQAKVICYANGILYECTPLDYLMSMYIVERPNPLGVPSPCQAGHAGYYEYPQRTDRFIYCDGNGVAYVVHCPSGSWYNSAARGCQIGTPPPVVVATTHTAVRTTAPPPVVTPASGSNPCTQDAINSGQRFFAYPQDPHKYYACTEWPNFAILKDCAIYHKWSQVDLACIYDNPAVDVNKDQYVSTPSAVQLGCTAGMHDGDLFFHPYPGDNTKFIQCDQFGDAFVKQCPEGRAWNQNLMTCLPQGLQTAIVGK